MKPTSDIFDLIHSLTKTEKRQFRVDSMSKKKNGVYLQLFETILKMKVYDEKRLKTEHADSPILKNLPVTKRFLYSQILKSLRKFSSYPIEQYRSAEELANIEILKHKGLYSQALKLFPRLEKKYRAIEDNLSLYKLLTEEVNIIQRMYDPVYDSRLHEIFTDQRVALAAVEQSRWTRECNFRFRVLIRKNRIAHTESQRRSAEDIISKLRDLKESQLLSYEASWNFHSCFHNYYVFVSDPETAVYHAERLLDLYQEQSEPVKIKFQTNYLESLLSNFNDCLSSGRFSDYKKRLDELEELIDTSQYAWNLWFLYSMVYSNTSGNFGPGLSNFSALEEKFSAHESETNPRLIAPIYAQLSYTHFGNGNFEEALQWNEKLIRDPKWDGEFFSFSRIVKVIYLFESGNFENFSSYVRSTYRTLVKQDRMYRVERSIIKIFNKVLSIKDKSQLSKLLADYLPELSILREDPKELAHFIFFDYDAWARSKVQKIEFKSAVKQRFNEHLSQ